LMIVCKEILLQTLLLQAYILDHSVSFSARML